jgi:hypothetical protein
MSSFSISCSCSLTWALSKKGIGGAFFDLGISLVISNLYSNWLHLPGRLVKRFLYLNSNA